MGGAENRIEYFKDDHGRILRVGIWNGTGGMELHILDSGHNPGHEKCWVPFGKAAKPERLPGIEAPSGIERLQELARSCPLKEGN